MTALADTERAVAEARRDVHEYFVLLAAPNADKARAAVARLEDAVRAHDAEVVRGEALHDDTGTDADEAYNQAINDAAGAISALVEHGETT